MNYINSPIEQITFNNQQYFIKRDDLLHPDFSGNKARKFYFYLKNNFPDIKKIISHGSAQSNAMYSISVLCKMKNLEFDYYVDHIASFLKEEPIGNYKYALKNGMNIKEEKLPLSFNSDELFIKEGGALVEASFGIKILAEEIKSWAKENKIEKLKIFLPSGTGTTALYLQKYLPFEILTCACVGDEEYLKKQFEMLEQRKHPKILQRLKKYHFGKLYKEFFDIHNELLKQTNIEYDLLYDSLGWICLNNYLNSINNIDFSILYIHQGGLIGNISMKERYLYKYKK